MMAINIYLEIKNQSGNHEAKTFGQTILRFGGCKNLLRESNWLDDDSNHYCTYHHKNKCKNENYVGRTKSSLISLFSFTSKNKLRATLRLPNLISTFFTRSPIEYRRLAVLSATNQFSSKILVCICIWFANFMKKLRDTHYSTIQFRSAIYLYNIVLSHQTF